MARKHSQSNSLIREAALLMVSLSVLTVLSGRLIDWAGFPMQPIFQIGAALLLTLFSLLALRPGLRSVAEITEQLEDIAVTRTVTEHKLYQVGPANLSADGWNRLIASAHVRRLVDAATENLSERDSERYRTDPGREVQIAELLTDGLAIVDGEGCVVWANASFSGLVGFESPVGSRFADLWRMYSDSGDHAEELSTTGVRRPAVFELSRGETADEGVCRLSRREIGGTRGEVLWTVRDVTAQKILMASRDHFVSAATHELRTPLSNILAYTETLIDQGDIELADQQQFLNTIRSEAGRLGRIIDDLLNLSRMQAGAMTLETHPVQVERLVGEVREKLKPLLELKSLNFEFQIPPRLPEVRIDKEKVIAAIVNLLGNAVKYTPDGGTIRFTVEHEAGRLAFHVEDTGIGIAPEDQQRVFDRFYRCEQDEVQQVTGSGLGLAWSRDVAQLHGGRIDLVSELGRGSRFTMILPVLKPNEAGRNSDRSAAVGHAESMAAESIA